MNQAVFERFLVDEDGATEAELTETFGVLLAPDLIEDKKRETTKSATSPPEFPQGRHLNRDWHQGVPARLTPAWGRLRAGLKKGELLTFPWVHFRPGSTGRRPPTVSIASAISASAEWKP